MSGGVCGNRFKLLPHVDWNTSKLVPELGLNLRLKLSSQFSHAAYFDAECFLLQVQRQSSSVSQIELLKRNRRVALRYSVG